ncbi:hypothetical protein [Pseudoprimorskyibacter insulae]|nr:hypothetical protein [Pseudoprimorskyibacter insulae]
MALQEKKTRAEIARRVNTAAQEHEKTEQTLTHVQALLREKANSPGQVMTAADLSAQHWLGTALAGQMTTLKNRSEESQKRFNDLKDQLNLQSQRERIVAEKALEAKRQARAHAQAMADEAMADRPRK